MIGNAVRLEFPLAPCMHCVVFRKNAPVDGHSRQRMESRPQQEFSRSRRRPPKAAPLELSPQNLLRCLVSHVFAQLLVGMTQSQGNVSLISRRLERGTLFARRYLCVPLHA